MIWLALSFILITDMDNHSAEPAAPNETAKNSTEEHSDNAAELQPSKDLLLFLAEWDETQDGQWIEPSTFAEDSAMTQQMEQQQINHRKNHENDPDHN